MFFVCIDCTRRVVMTNYTNRMGMWQAAGKPGKPIFKMSSQDEKCVFSQGEKCTNIKSRIRKYCSFRHAKAGMPGCVSGVKSVPIYRVKAVTLRPSFGEIFIKIAKTPRPGIDPTTGAIQQRKCAERGSQSDRLHPVYLSRAVWQHHS